MRRPLLVSAIASLIMIVLLRWQGASLITEVTPRGIVDLELVRTLSGLQQMLNVWSLSDVRINIWLDFIFIAAYTSFLSLAVAACSIMWHNKVMQFLGLVLVRLAFVAGLLDVAENLLMLQSIQQNVTTASLQLTFYCASVKFGSVALILLYNLFSLPLLAKRK